MSYANAYSPADIMATQNFNMMIDTQRSMLMQRVFRQQNQEAKSARSSSPPPKATARPPVAVPAKPAAWGFGHTLAVTRQVHDLIVSPLAQARGQASVEAFDRQFGDIQATFGRVVAPFGLDPHDLVDVIAAYTVAMWMNVNQQTTLPSRAAVQAVRAQVASAFSAAPQGALTNPDKRQFVAEAMMYQTCVAIVQREAASSQDLRATLAQKTQKQLTNSHSDLSNLTLTENGFALR